MSRNRDKAYRCCACTPPAPMPGSIAASSMMNASPEISVSSPLTCPGMVNQPPAGWQDADYKLTSRDYVRMIVEVADALDLDKPVAVGCSIGGRIVLHLAHEHPERFRALVGLECAA